MIRSATLFNTARPVAFPAPFISPLVPGLGRRFSPVELRLNLSRPVVLGNYAGHNYSGLTEDAGESSTRFWVLEPKLGDHPGKKGALGPWVASVSLSFWSYQGPVSFRCGVSARGRASRRGVTYAFSN